MWKRACYWFLFFSPILAGLIHRDKRDDPFAKQKIQVLSGPEYNQTAFPDPKNCKRFFICNGGIFHLRCPVGLVFNTDLSKCDLQPRGVDRSALRRQPVEYDDDLLVFPDHTDPAQLYLCDGISQQYECSGELFYNADYMKCDLLGSLTCRIRWNA